MDIADLTIFINACRKYSKRVDYIEINNTSNINRYFDNIMVRAILNVTWKMPNLENKIPHSVNRWNKTINKINREINTHLGYIKFECKNEEQSIITKEIIYKNIKEYSNVNCIKLYHNGQLCSNLHKMEEQIINKKKYTIMDEIKNELLKDDKFIKYCFNEVYQKKWDNISLKRFKLLNDKIEKIDKTIEKNKNSYIISKLLSGEFKTNDVKKYPELIKATDELTKIKILLT